MSLSTPVFRPPSEAQSVIIQINHGCPHNSCEFCGMYKTKPYIEKSVDEILSDIDEIPDYIKQSARRIFLADGDAMKISASSLEKITGHLNAVFPSLQRISAYATCRSINRFSEHALKRLNGNRLRLFYIGLESGSERLLRFCGKNMSIDEYYSAADLIHQSGGKISLTAILGLGGREFTESHGIATAEAVNRIRPRYFSLLTLIFGGNENYIQKIKPLTSGEILEEMKNIVGNISARTIFRSNHVSNLYALSGNLPKDKESIVSTIDDLLDSAEAGEFLNKVPQFEGENSY